MTFGVMMARSATSAFMTSDDGFNCKTRLLTGPTSYTAGLIE